MSYNNIVGVTLNEKVPNSGETLVDVGLSKVMLYRSFCRLICGFHRFMFLLVEQNGDGLLSIILKSL